MTIDAIGKFQVIARLGRGGMGDALLAFESGPAFEGGLAGVQRLVVVKILHEEFNSGEQLHELFLAEARISARLTHPNVVHTHEVGELNGKPYLCMEYLDGQPLSAMKRHRDQVSAPLAARIMSEALSGLHYAHELEDYDGTPLHIVHRDLSPHNIFITYDGMVKILDFGIAKSESLGAKTQTGVLKGKITYMAPEQLDGVVDRRADIFVAGIVLWELLARRRLFKVEARMAKTFHALLSKEISPLSSIVDDIDPDLEAIVAKALERDPDERYQTAQDMRFDLDRYLDRAGHIRREEVGELMQRLFAKRRGEIAQRIRTFISTREEQREQGELPDLLPPGTGLDTGSELNTGSEPSLSRKHSATPISTTTAAAAMAQDKLSEAPTMLLQEESRGRSGLILGLAAIAAATLVIIVFMFTSRTGEATAPASAPAGESAPTIAHSAAAGDTSIPPITGEPMASAVPVASAAPIGSAGASAPPISSTTPDEPSADRPARSAKAKARPTRRQPARRAPKTPADVATSKETAAPPPPPPPPPPPAPKPPPPPPKGRVFTTDI